jgi:hypothetical protein
VAMNFGGFGPMYVGPPAGGFSGGPWAGYGGGGWGGYGMGGWGGFGFPAFSGLAPGIALSMLPQPDPEIAAFVERAIDNDPTIPAHANIDVAVRNGIVTLTGTVSNKRIKHAAGDDAWFVPWVIDVHNEINVVPRTARTAQAAGQTREQSENQTGETVETA